MRPSLILSVLVLCASSTAWAAPTPPSANNLDALLQEVRQGAGVLGAQAQTRQQEFLAHKDQRAAMLEEAKAEEARRMARSLELEGAFEAGERRTVEQQQQLQERMGQTGELFGVVRQVAGDTRALLGNSLVSAELGARTDGLDPLTNAKSLPTLEELEFLWFTLHQELTESGKVARFSAPVVHADGSVQQEQVTRVGTFSAFAGGKYLKWEADAQKLVALPRQPQRRYMKTLTRFGDTEPGETGVVAVDPSRGTVLSMLVQTPNLRERIEFGGAVGYTILALGALGFLLAVARLVYLSLVSWSVDRQRRRPDAPSRKNPLGRVLDVYANHRELEVEALERKLDDVVLRESGRVQRLLWLVRVVSVVAPLLGLLGTVTGMIQTFQAITLFGTGDPKLMAGGISEALVTTMLGLVVAIPLLLLHSGVSSLARRIVGILQEQATGLIASQAERASS